MVLHKHCKSALKAMSQSRKRKDYPTGGARRKLSIAVKQERRGH
jgi:hypothetical protein